MRRTLLLVSVMVLLPLRLVGAQSLPAEKRLALVVGNGKYDTSPLRNPVNDARAMAEALRAVGFDVLVRENVTQKDLRRAVLDFGDRLSRDKGVGLFFYAGHGVQVKGRNYMLPVDAVIASEAEVEVEGVDVASVLARMETARNPVNIVILDACRDNPFASRLRGATRGLASIAAPSGTMIAYATAPGDVASDGEGSHSVYTGALVKSLVQPGLRVEDVFKRVRAEVRQRTGGRQVPWESSSLEGDFVFAGKAAVAVAPAPAPAVAPPSVALTPPGTRSLPGRLAVWTATPGVEVWVGEQRLGEPRMGTPLLAEVAAGEHKVIARLGGRMLERNVPVASDGRTDIKVHLAAPNAPGSLLNEVLAIVEKQYIGPLDFTAFRTGALRGLEQALPPGALKVASATELTIRPPGGGAARLTLAPPASRQETLGDLVFVQSLAREIDPSMTPAAIQETFAKRGLSGLDAHSSYLDREAYRELQVAASGASAGLGMDVTLRDDGAVIVSPVEGTPAHGARLLTGDRILTVDGASVTDWPLADLVRRLRGAPGSKVTLTIARDSQPAPWDVELVRVPIRVQSVESREIEPGLLYAKLRQFQEYTAKDLEAALGTLGGGFLQPPSRLKGVVLDLRNNPGGLLNVAVEVAQQFIDRGKLIAYAEGRAKNQNARFTANGSKVYTDVPMVVLVNEGTASASEIVAGALQHYGRAVGIGVRSFGKGTIQTIHRLSDGGGLRLTTAQYFTPNGRKIQGVGITPDITVEAPAGGREDVQLERAVTHVKSLMKR